MKDHRLLYDAYYYGCHGDTGHYLWARQDSGILMHVPTHAVRDLPWGFHVDGSLAPSHDRTEGLAMCHWRDGWAALAFWDQSVDTRPGANSVFLFRGPLTFEQAVSEAKLKFPEVWQRFKFEVRRAP